MAGSESGEGEEDYMSDAFLLAAETAPAPSAREHRGLLSGTERRKARLEERRAVANKASKKKTHKELEAEAREEALAKPIATSNKGFALLEKIGYRPGMGLGKKEEGRSEPVGVAMRPARMGLGQEQEQMRAAAEVEERKRMREEAKSRDMREREVGYREWLGEERKRKATARALSQSQHICEDLDRAQGVTESELWAQPPEEEGEEQVETRTQEEISAETAAKLSAVTHHLRSAYHYCYWCGHAFADAKELASLCPGDTAEAHED
eukprot:comp21980_c1_seq1/m.31759 comp21980_c1_seq1/g.31759  ORF comp21980_c1_seq1/g.31759 comp21980_c1_seq1/m.31759 type:complete len:266 (-) comp21980_c1_seq1:67-864(-)